MSREAGARAPGRRSVSAPLLAALLAAACAAASPAVAEGAGSFWGPGHPGRGSLWAGLASATSSDIRISGPGVPGGSDEADFGPFLEFGGRFEYFPFRGAGAARHVGFGVDAVALWGEAEVDVGGGRHEDLPLFTSALAPYVMFRFPGQRWEGYLGLGVTIAWWTGVNDADIPEELEDSDFEVPLGASLVAGGRLAIGEGGFFLMEGRYQAGDNDLAVRESGVDAAIEWRLFQVVAGAGYRF